MSITTAPPEAPPRPAAVVGTTPPPWGPVEVGGRRHRGPRRAATLLGLALPGLLVILLVLGFLLVGRVGASIDRLDVGGLQSGDGPRHLLVVGSDSREDLTAEERKELTTGSFEGVRTDSIFVLSLDGEHAGILAFPRDLWLERCDGTVGRINAAYGIGGATCLVETISAASGLPIEHYLEIDFLGFRDLVDAVGGVELCLDDPIKDKDAGIDLPAGCQTLGGVDALGYVRVRKIDNDLERIKRQQVFVAALAEKLLDRDRMTDVGHLLRVSAAAGGAVTADAGLGPIDLVRLASDLRAIATGDLVTATVPTRPVVVDGAKVLVEAQGAARAYRDQASGEALRVLDDRVEVSDLRVAVQNATGVEGLATRTAELLGAAGVRVVDVGNRPNPGLTVIQHPADQAGEAALLATLLPLDPLLEEVEGTEALVLVLGGDYPTD